MSKNENLSWDLNLTWELNHEKGIAQATLTLPDGSKKSMRYVQGMYFNENGKIVDQKDGDMIIRLLELCKDKK